MKTTDIWFAAFLKKNGYKITSFVQIKRGRGEYTFDISREDYGKEKLDFFNSDFSKMKQIIEELKDLVY